MCKRPLYWLVLCMCERFRALCDIKAMPAEMACGLVRGRDVEEGEVATCPANTVIICRFTLVSELNMSSEHIFELEDDHGMILDTLALKVLAFIC